MNRMKRFFHLDLLTYLHLITIVITIQIAFYQDLSRKRCYSGGVCHAIFLILYQIDSINGACK